MNDLKIIEINDKLYKYGISDNIPEDAQEKIFRLLVEEASNNSFEDHDEDQ